MSRRVLWLLVLAAAVGRPAGAAPPDGFYIAPYLQNVTPDGATIMWETPAAERGAVEYGRAEGGSLSRTAVEKGAATIHRVRLSGLRPDTAYRYRVARGGSARSAGFRTAPAAARPIRFAVIGDSRFWGERWESSRLPEHLEAQAPEFSLHMGDLVNNGEDYSLWPAHFTRFARHMSRAPMYPARGNHERSGDDPDNDWFGRYFELPGGEPFTSFDWGNAHFAVVSFVALERDLAGTLAFLERDLGASRKPWKLVAFHYPVYCTGYYRPDDGRKASGHPELEAVLDRHRVDMVLNGHTHIYERSFPYRAGRRDDRNGTVYLVQGGSVGGHYPDRWSALVFTEMDMPHYSVIDLGADRLELRSYGLAKGTVDQGMDAPIIEIDHLVRWRDERLPRAALARLASEDAAVLAEAAEALGAMGYRPAARRLVALLDHAREPVRHAAALALERIADRGVASALLAHLEHEDVVVRRHVARALECVLPPGLARFVAPHARSEGQDAQVRVSLLGALLLHAPEQAHPVAWELMESPAAAVRARAADVVKRTAGRERLADLLRAFQAETDPFIAGCLAWGLNRLTGKSVDVRAAGESGLDAREEYLKEWRGT